MTLADCLDAAILLLALAGCAAHPSFDAERRAIEVIRAAARDTGLGELPPRIAIEYHEGCVPCAGNPGCFAGCSYGDEVSCRIVLGYWDGSFARSELAHEAIHRLLAAIGMQDARHETAVWTDDEPRVQAALEMAGL